MTQRAVSQNGGRRHASKQRSHKENATQQLHRKADVNGTLVPGDKNPTADPGATSSPKLGDAKPIDVGSARRARGEIFQYLSEGGGRRFDPRPRAPNRPAAPLRSQDSRFCILYIQGLRVDEHYSYSSFSWSKHSILPLRGERNTVLRAHITLLATRRQQADMNRLHRIHVACCPYSNAQRIFR